MDQRFAEVTAAMSDYFDGLYRSDTSLLGKVFHPDAHYACATEGTLTHLTMAQVLSGRGQTAITCEPQRAARGQDRINRVCRTCYGVRSREVRHRAETLYGFSDIRSSGRTLADHLEGFFTSIFVMSRRQPLKRCCKIKNLREGA
ncbi:MAG: nuclear transport factor 2 family protein [Afipia sp.]